VIPVGKVGQARRGQDRTDKDRNGSVKDCQRCRNARGRVVGWPRKSGRSGALSSADEHTAPERAHHVSRGNTPQQNKHCHECLAFVRHASTNLVLRVGWDG